MNVASVISSRTQIRWRALVPLLGLLLALGWFTGDPPALAASPTVTNVAPNQGKEAGGTAVTISGENLAGGTVKFGTVEATEVTVNAGGTQITAQSPAGTGTVDVTVTTLGGTSATGPGDLFTYVPPPAITAVAPSEGPEVGGTAVTIMGTNLSDATAVEFGSANASGVTVNAGGTQITATSPAGAGTVDVTVTTPGGASVSGPGDLFTYIPLPTITAVAPREGPEGGGTVVTITGTHLTGATVVKFGAAEATGVAVNGEGTEITAASPSGSGTVDVTVTTPGGTSATASPDRFSYVPPAIVVLLPPSGSSLAPSSPPVVVVVPPSPAPVPKKGAVVCTLKVDHVHLPGKTPSARKRAKPRAGTLTVIMTCDQAASVTLRGKLIQPIGRPKHGKQHTRRLPFGFATASVKAGVPKALTLRLPKPAVIGLEHRKAQKISFTIVTKPVTATT
jgi:hypothetical protein